MITPPLFIVAFGFTSPLWLLAGVAFSAVPILIHLLYRRHHEQHGWAAMAILQRAIQQQVHRRRLESWIQLVVRTAIILCAAIALARPYTASSPKLAGSARSMRRIVVIDDSLSMAYASGNETSFDRARRIAAEIVSLGDVGETTSIVRLGQNSQIVAQRPAVESDRLLKEISQLAVSEGEADVLSALRLINRELTDAKRGNCEVYLLSDFQLTNWLPRKDERTDVATELSAIAEAAHVVFVNVGAIQNGNHAWTALDAAPPASATLSASEIEARVRSYGRPTLDAVPVELIVDGRSADERRIDLEPDAEETVRFYGLTQSQLETAVELRMAPDGLAADDERRLVIPGAVGWEVLLVSGRLAEPQRPGATRFVEMALNPHSAQASPERASGFNSVVIPDGQLQSEDLSRYDCVFLCDVPLLSRVEVEMLRNYVESGGGLIIALGAGVRAADYNQFFFDGPTSLLPIRIEGPVGDPASSDDVFHFVPGDDSHPLLHAFAGNQHAGLATTQIYRYLRVSIPSKSGVSVPLRYDSGDPAIIEQRLGAGRVLLVTTSVDDQWGNWALWPSFLPLIHEMTRLAATNRFEGRQLTVGDTIVRRIPSQVTEVSLVGPGQSEIPVEIGHDHRGTFITSLPLEQRGFYELRYGADPQTLERFAVNVSSAESDLTGLRRSDIVTELLPEAEFEYASSWRGDMLRGTQLDDRLAGLGQRFLMAAALLLLVDQLIAWRFRVGLTLLVGFGAAAMISWAGGDLRASAIGFCGVAMLSAFATVMQRRRSSTARQH